MNVRTSFFVLLLWTNAQAAGPGTPKPHDIVSAASSSGGNAEIYGGGDVFFQRLSTARNRLLNSLTLVTRGHDVQNLCSAAACSLNEATLCPTLQKLNEKQTETCRTFLTGQASNFIQLANEKVTPFTVSQMPLFVKTSTGANLQVAAMTKSNRKSPIVFHYGLVNQLSDNELVSLITHELGHKLQIEGSKNITDNNPVLGFSDGRQLLDSLGAATASYSASYSVPSQSPPASPKQFLSQISCAMTASSTSRWLVGLNVDLLGVAPTEQALKKQNDTFEKIVAENKNGGRLKFTSDLIATIDVRKKSISQLFEKALGRVPSAEESELMLERLNDGTGYDSLFAAILGDQDYFQTRAKNKEDAFLKALFTDLTGKSPSESEIKDHLRRLKKADRASFALYVFQSRTEPVDNLIKGWYERWLNRTPSESELKNFGEGLRSNNSWESVQASLLSSAEYQVLQTLRFPSCDRSTASENSNTGSTARPVLRE